MATNAEEVEVLKRLNRLPDTLPSIGLKMKTGLTVDFRNREALRDHAEANAVPLFYSQHIKSGKVEFPIGKESEYLVTEQNGLLQKNSRRSEKSFLPRHHLALLSRSMNGGNKETTLLNSKQMVIFLEYGYLTLLDQSA